ncbi:MAG: hypothetical protein KDA96_09585, partial [Planctomycetaceae bacterium]|nr:hypothetical protein [Planctomycetaceae bacterium]
MRHQVILLAMLVFVSRCSAVAAQQESDDAFSVSVVTGYAVFEFSPVDFLSWLDTLADKSNDQPGRPVTEIRRSLERRFGNTLHLPVTKGRLIVQTPVGLQNVDFEQAFDETGATDLIGSFASQWEPAEGEEVEHPNYETRLTRIAAGQWKLDVVDLSWASRIRKSTDEERQAGAPDTIIAWEKQETGSTSTYFRLHDHWLFSSSNEATLSGADLRRLARDIPTMTEEQGFRPWAVFWQNPRNYPEPLRNA